MHIDGDLGMLDQKGLKRLHQFTAAKASGSGDADWTGQLGLALLHHPFQLVELIQQGQAALIIGPAGVREGDAAGGPVEQLRSKPLFQFLNILAAQFGRDAPLLCTLFNAPVDAQACATTAQKVLTKLDAHMQSRDFLVADRPTIADVAIYSYTALAPEGNIALEPYPEVLRLLTNIEALPGFLPMPPSKVGLMA